MISIACARALRWSPEEPSGPTLTFCGALQGNWNPTVVGAGFSPIAARLTRERAMLLESQPSLTEGLAR